MRKFENVPSNEINWSAFGTGRLGVELARSFAEWGLGFIVSVRDHSKMWSIIDESKQIRVAYIHGSNFDRRWSEGEIRHGVQLPSRFDGGRRFTGDAALAIEALLKDSWESATVLTRHSPFGRVRSVQRRLLDPNMVAELPPSVELTSSNANTPWSGAVQPLKSYGRLTSDQTMTAATHAMIEAINAAYDTVWITGPYFGPIPQPIKRALKAKADVLRNQNPPRELKIKLVTNGPQAQDNRAAMDAAVLEFAEFRHLHPNIDLDVNLTRGVFTHWKGIIVNLSEGTDELMSTEGSVNPNGRSLENDIESLVTMLCNTYAHQSLDMWNLTRGLATPLRSEDFQADERSRFAELGSVVASRYV